MRGSIFDRWKESLVGFEAWCPEAYRVYYARRAFRIVMTLAGLRRLGRWVREGARRRGQGATERPLAGAAVWRYREESLSLRRVRGTYTPEGVFREGLPPVGSAARESWVRLYAMDPAELPSLTVYREGERYYLEAKPLPLMTLAILRLRAVERVRARVGRRVDRCPAFAGERWADHHLKENDMQKPAVVTMAAGDGMRWTGKEEDDGFGDSSQPAV